jgi:hypothetical protein
VHTVLITSVNCWNFPAINRWINDWCLHQPCLLLAISICSLNHALPLWKVSAMVQLICRIFCFIRSLYFQLIWLENFYILALFWQTGVPYFVLLDESRILVFYLIDYLMFLVLIQWARNGGHGDRHGRWSSNNYGKSDIKWRGSASLPSAASGVEVLCWSATYVPYNFLISNIPPHKPDACIIYIASTLFFPG